jgi:hypothetical protein
MVAAGAKTGIAMADDGGLLLFDNHGVMHVPPNGIIRLAAAVLTTCWSLFHPQD